MNEADGVSTHETILSGDLHQDDAPNLAGPSLLSHAARQDNAYTVVTANDLTRPTVLDGMTITGGNSSGTGYNASTCGGGIYSKGSDALSITNSTVSHNSAYVGGGIFSPAY